MKTLSQKLAAATLTGAMMFGGSSALAQMEMVPVERPTLTP